MKPLLLVSFLSLTLTTACSSTSKPSNASAEEKKQKSSFFSDNGKSDSVFNQYDPAQTPPAIKPKIPSRKEQIEISLKAAIADRVEPILLTQPLNKTIYFHFSSPVVEDKWTDLLNEHVKYVSSDMSLRLMVAGFTDNIGSSKYNLKLGQRRADNVCSKLFEMGARKEQLTCVSYGESHPVDKGSDEAARAKNRRVLFLY